MSITFTFLSFFILYLEAPKYVSELSHAVMSNSLRPRGLYSPSCSSIHEIFQARILEWIAKCQKLQIVIKKVILSLFLCGYCDCQQGNGKIL